VEEFEKRLTAVHTRGLENVESPEMEGGSTDKMVTHTPQTARGRGRAKRGKSHGNHGGLEGTLLNMFDGEMAKKLKPLEAYVSHHEQVRVGHLGLAATRTLGLEHSAYPLGSGTARCCSI